MKKITSFRHAITALLIVTCLALLTANAQAAATSQKGLRELEPKLFARHNLDRETGCLAAALYFEARAESRSGLIAVAQVILNRAKAGYFPSDICGVVWQNSHKKNRCQFSFTCDGRADVVKEPKLWLRAAGLARAILSNKSRTAATNPLSELKGGMRRATHYHATFVSPRWSKKLARMGKVGSHIFYVSKQVEKTMDRGA